jgi:hypothetical protein
MQTYPIQNVALNDHNVSFYVNIYCADFQFVIYLDYVGHALWTFGILED